MDNHITVIVIFRMRRLTWENLIKKLSNLAIEKIVIIIRELDKMILGTMGLEHP